MKKNRILDLKLDRDWPEVGDILTCRGHDLRVLETPTPYYNKWYWRLLNWLTFRLFFNVKETYKLEVLGDEE